MQGLVWGNDRGGYCAWVETGCDGNLWGWSGGTGNRARGTGHAKVGGTRTGCKISDIFSSA